MMTDATFWEVQCLFQLHLILLLSTYCLCLPEIIKLGGIFDNPYHEMYFRDAVDMVNKQMKYTSESVLSAEVEQLSPGDSFQAISLACDLLEQGVAVIFGPESPVISNLVQKMCRKYDIPYVQVNWSHQFTRDTNILNLHPTPNDLGRAYTDFVKLWTYGRFSVVYRDSEALVRLKELLETFVTRENYNVRQHFKNEMYHKVLKEVAKSGESNLVIDLPVEEIHDFLQAADEFRLMTEYNNYLLTSLDAHCRDLGDSWKGLTNITAFRVVRPMETSLPHYLPPWIFEREDFISSKSEDVPLKIHEALFYDGVAVIARALTELDRIHSIEPQKFSCEGEGKWRDGNATINYIKMTEFPGYTGVIKFNENGERMVLAMDVVQFKSDGLVKIGNWSREGGVMLDVERISLEEAEKALKGKTLKVTSVLAHPYVEVQEGKGLKGNDRYRGYCVDLLNHISEMKGFNYELSIAPENSRGVLNEAGEWDGMIRELLFKRADLAIGDLTITTQRQDAVDFTTPFMNLGIGILMKKGARREPTLFSFLFPFRTEVWIYMATAYLGVTMIMYILGRLSPYEWSNPHPCELYPVSLENQFNFSNSLWFTIGSVMQQGSDFAPRALSTRLAAGFWWFFTLIMVSTYTANLAAFLTSVRLQSPIKNVKDLAQQKSIPYGCLERGSTRAFFQRSLDYTYRQMSNFMEGASPSVFTNSTEDGVTRVMKGNYAFLMETTSILYNTQRHCELTQLGEKLVDINYGIAAPKDSPYITILSECIIRLQERGVLADLKTRWWETNNTCPDEDSSTSKNKLGITNLGGVFVVLGIGVGSACILMMIELIWKTKSIPKEERSCLCIEILKRLKDVLLCRGSTRSVEATSLYALDDSITRSSLLGTTSAKTITTTS